MHDKDALPGFRQDDNTNMQSDIPVKMFVACFFSCVLGIVLMAFMSKYLLVGAYVGLIVIIVTNAFLYSAGRIRLETACLAPMVLLCFVYTPISWFTFDGLLGCTPYLSILYMALIALTSDRKPQTILLSLYAVLMLGLTIHWFATFSGGRDMEQILNILVAYVLAAALIVYTVETVKRNHDEINKSITDLSMRDDLTGLLNRRAIEQVLRKLEKAFVDGGAEYAVVMMDINRLKSINDLYGHNLGDSAIKSIASCIRANVRTADYAFRYGGDEFLLILPNIDEANPHQVCSRIEAATRGVQGYAFPITVSMGYALRSESANTTAVLELADQRMYMAKKGQSAQAAGSK